MNRLAPLLAEASAPWRGTRALALLAGVTVAIASVGLLALAGWFITAAAIAGAAGSSAARAFNYLVPSATIRLLAILRTAGRYFERLLSHRASLSTLATLRAALFARAAAAEASGARRLSGGEAAALLGEDVDRLEDRLIRAPALAGAAVGAAFAVALGALAGIGPALAIAACLATSALATRHLARRLLPERSAEAAAALHALKIATAEHAACAGEIMVYDLTGRVTAALEDLARRHDAALRRLARAEAAIGAVTPAFAGIASGLAVASASGGPALAAMAALAAAASGEVLAGLARAEIRAPSVTEAATRLEDIASAEPALNEPGSIAAPPLTIEIGGIANDLPPGSRVLLAGRSGAGKTRLVETLVGLRGDAPQRLAIDGAEVRTLSLQARRGAFALVPQAPMLIAGTVLDNLRVARRGVDEAAAWEALETACLDAEVRALPQGLDTWIGEGGAALSGGQRKRLALARGLLAGRPWLLLDEPTEGLDAATEARVVAQLAAWLERTEAGLILVSHRVAPRALCDKVIALEP